MDESSSARTKTARLWCGHQESAAVYVSDDRGVVVCRDCGELWLVRCAVHGLLYREQDYCWLCVEEERNVRQGGRL